MGIVGRSPTSLLTLDFCNGDKLPACEKAGAIALERYRWNPERFRD
jgi:hypothetical protein